MTPKEKALELVEKFKDWAYDGTDTHSDAASSHESAIEIAKIAVDEILKIDLSKPYQEENYLAHWWAEVKRELDQLSHDKEIKR